MSSCDTRELLQLPLNPENAACVSVCQIHWLYVDVNASSLILLSYVLCIPSQTDATVAQDVLATSVSS